MNDPFNAQTPALISPEAQLWADRIAERAIKKTFAILGVEIDNPEKVESFRQDLRFAGSMRRFAGQGVIVFFLGIIGFIAAALWVGLGVTFSNAGNNPPSQSSEETDDFDASNP